MMSEPNAEARRLADEGRRAEQHGDPTAALDAYARAATLLEGDGPVPLLADVVRWTGTVHRELGNLPEADRHYARALALAEQAEHGCGQAHALNCMAIVAQRRGTLDRAQQLFHSASALAEEHGETRLRAMVQHNLGILADNRGDRPQALACFQAALVTFRQAEDRCGECEVLNSLGILHGKLEAWAESEAAFARGIALADELGAAAIACIMETNRAEMRACAGLADEAEADLRSPRLANEGCGPRRMAERLKARARVQEERGELGDALELLERARALAAEAGDPLLEAEVMREAGEAWRRKGERERAREVWTEALRGFDGIGARGDAADVEARLARLAA
jgi:tetratricopeptide (TPR) repeat protein